MGCCISPDVRCGTSERIKSPSQGVTIDKTCATHCEGQRWVGITIEPCERIASDGDWTNQDVEVRACVADRIVCVVERALVDGEDADIGCDRCRAVQGTGQCVAVYKACSRVGEGRVGIAVETACCICGHRQRARSDTEIRASVADGIVWRCRNCALGDGIGANVGGNSRRAVECACHSVTVHKSSTAQDISEGRIGIAINA